MEKVKEKKGIVDYYSQVRKMSETLCLPLEAEDFVVQPIVDVSPPKWHLAHSTWFFETFILSKYYKGYKLFNPNYNYLFNSYYETIGNRLLRANRGNLTRPSFREVLEYRNYVDKHMIKLLSDNFDQQLLSFLDLGMNHEQQHQELLVTDIKYILGHNPLFPAYSLNHINNGEEFKVKKPAFIEIPDGLYEIGFKDQGFSYDIESPVHKVFLNSFGIMNRLITNQEYLEFVEDGGYSDFRHWHMEGWEIVKAKGWEAPLYWIKKENTWLEYTLTGLKKLNLSSPVTHISFYEASAFAAWKGKRLLTEAEWEVAANIFSEPAEAGNFLERSTFHPLPCADDNYQILGDAWEWTYSAFHPYPGYKREEGALGEYNGKFMINQMVLRGGSCATPVTHIRTSYRNFFHPDKRWQFTGIRLAENY